MPAVGWTAPVLSPEQVAAFHRDRFIIVSGVWPSELLAQHTAVHAQLFPEPTVTPGLDTAAHGGSVQFPFPAEQMAANLVTLHPRIMTAATGGMVAVTVALTLFAGPLLEICMRAGEVLTHPVTITQIDEETAP